MTGRSAASLGLAGCHDCGLVSRVTGHASACPRCGATLHLRKPDSLGRAWALLIAAGIWRSRKPQLESTPNLYRN